MLQQGSHRLEKCLNIQDCLEKSLKIQFKNDLKNTKGLEKSLNFTIYRRIQQCFWNLNQYEIVVPLFGAAYAPLFYTNYLKLISLVMDSSISEVEF